MNFERSLSIWNKLPKGAPEATLMFCFDASRLPADKKIFPVAWTVFTFRPDVKEMIGFDYFDQLIFTKANISENREVTTDSWVEITAGHSTHLKEDKTGRIYFTEPTKSSFPNRLFATNDTTAHQDMGIGFVVKPEGHPEVKPVPINLFVRRSVGPKESLFGPFELVVQCYLNAGYKELQIVDRIHLLTPLWAIDLLDKSVTDSYDLTYDSTTGKYALVPHVQTE